jgi:ubiquitin-protein ligase
LVDVSFLSFVFAKLPNCACWLAEWDGVIFLQQELYGQGVFRFRLDIPEAFPCATPPRVFFLSSVFHPAIDPTTGELDLTRKFPAWRWVYTRVVRTGIEG